MDEATTMLKQQALAEAIKAHSHREWAAKDIVEAAEVYYQFLSGTVSREPTKKPYE